MTTLLRRESGQMLIQAAVTLTSIIGITALSVDASFMYEKRNRLFAAADAAAKSAALELKRYPNLSASVPPLATLQNYANYEVAKFPSLSPGGATTVVVNHPPLNGSFSGNSNYVEVLVSEPTNTFFAKILGWTNFTPGARAVAGVTTSTNCIVTLGDPGFADSLTVQGGGSSATIGLTNCGISAAKNLKNAGTVAVTGASIVTGTCSGNCAPASMTPAAQQGAPAPADPLEGKYLTPADPNAGLGNCASVSVPPDRVLSEGCYNDVTVSGTGNLTLSAGTFYIRGKISTSGSSPSISGSGVMIYLAPGKNQTSSCAGGGDALSACISLGNKTSLSLSPPTSGPYEGLLFYQDRANINIAIFDANYSGHAPIGLAMSGTLYFPGALLQFNNHLNTSGDCIVMVAKRLWFGAGRSDLQSACSTLGGAPMLTASMAE